MSTLGGLEGYVETLEIWKASVGHVIGIGGLRNVRSDM